MALVVSAKKPPIRKSFNDNILTAIGSIGILFSGCRIMSKFVEEEINNEINRYSPQSR